MTTLAFYQLHVNYAIICKSWNIIAWTIYSHNKHVPQATLLVEHNDAKANQKKTKERKELKDCNNNNKKKLTLE